MSERRLWWIQRFVGVILSVSIAVPLHAPAPAQAVCTPGGMTEWPISGTLVTGIGNSPNGVYLQGYLWVYSYVSPRIVRIDPSDGSELAYSSWPTGVTHSQDKTLLSDGTYLWVVPETADSNNAIVRINPSDGSMTAYQNWPTNVVDALKRYTGAVFDGTYIWMYPSDAEYLIRFNVSNGSMKAFNSWPESFANGTDSFKFEKAVVNGSTLYLIPRSVFSLLQPPRQHIIKVNVTNGKMTTIPWPVTFLPNGGVYSFEDALFVNGYLWLFVYSWAAPQAPLAILRVDPQTGTVVTYNSWPAGFTDGFVQPWREAVYDGTDIWLVPASANMVIQLDPSTGTMTGYNNWPAGLSPMSVTFGGGIYDGTSVWLYPSHIATYGNYLQLVSCSTSSAPQPAVPPPVSVAPSPPRSSTVPEVVVTPPPPPPPAIFAASYPYQDSGTMNMEINANYATWDDMGIKALPLLNDMVSISLTLQFYADIPKRSLLGAIPANTQSCGAIGNGLNTAERVPPHREGNLYQFTLKPQIFTQTNHVYHCYFEDVWKRAGGISRLGYPVSEAYVQTDPDTGEQRYIQYAERGRLEQPVLEDGSLGLPQFGLLGAEYLAQQDPLPAAVLPVAVPSDPTITYFAETRHTLQGKFAEDFYGNGGLELNGYPLTEPFIETYAEYPYPVTVQYFERVRMEYHGDPADPLYGQMTLGRIGAAVYAGNQP